jgi:putative RNA 2'-phosphotransferase
MSRARDVTISKMLSRMLRHRPRDFGITLDEAGWAHVDGVLAALDARGSPVTRDELLALVRANDKQRFALSPDGQRIRAQQGHSVDVDLGYAPADPPEVLYHGTVARFLPSIRQTGLERGGRHHVHLSSSREQAEKVGRRRGAPIVIVVLAGRMRAAGHEFLLTPNGVWLTEHVPAGFLVFPW